MPPDRKPVAPLGSCDIAAQHTPLCHFFGKCCLTIGPGGPFAPLSPFSPAAPCEKQAMSVILSWTSGHSDSYQRTGQTTICYPNKKLGHPSKSPEQLQCALGQSLQVSGSPFEA